MPWNFYVTIPIGQHFGIMLPIDGVSSGPSTEELRKAREQVRRRIYRATFMGPKPVFRKKQMKEATPSCISDYDTPREIEELPFYVPSADEIQAGVAEQELASAISMRIQSENDVILGRASTHDGLDEMRQLGIAQDWAMAILEDEQRTVFKPKSRPKGNVLVVPRLKVSY